MSFQTICSRPDFWSVSKVSLPNCSCGLSNIINVAKTTSHKINQMSLVVTSVMSFYLVCSTSLGTDILSLAILHPLIGDIVPTMQLIVAWRGRRGCLVILVFATTQCLLLVTSFEFNIYQWKSFMKFSSSSLKYVKICSQQSPSVYY